MIISLLKLKRPLKRLKWQKPLEVGSGWVKRTPSTINYGILQFSRGWLCTSLKKMLFKSTCTHLKQFISVLNSKYITYSDLNQLQQMPSQKTFKKKTSHNKFVVNTNRILFDLNFKRIHSYFFGVVEKNYNCINH